MFQSIYTTIIRDIQKSLKKGSDWIIDSAGSSYIKLLKELDHPRKGLINVQNIDDNECFKWCLVRYLNHHPAEITKSDKEFAKRLDFKHIKFPVKTRDIQKIEKRTLFTFAFLVMKTK